MTDRQKYCICSLLFLMVGAILLTWFLEYRYFVHDMWRTWNFIFSNPRPFLFNSLLMYLLLCVIWGLVGSAGTTVGASWVFLTILSYIHIAKYNSRGTPLLPEDFQLASEAHSLSKFVSIWTIVRLLLAIAIVITLTILFNKKLARRLHLTRPKRASNFVQKYCLGIRLAVLVIGMLGFYRASDFARHNDGSRYQDIFLGTRFTAWNQNRNYDENGFILGFLYNLQKLQLEEPNGYDEAIISQIEKKYTKIASEKNTERAAIGDQNVSVVIILNESFFDPDFSFNGKSFTDYYPHDGGEVAPNLHRIQSQYPSGMMYTLDYGGGTANIEFETFTGLTNYWVNTVPYTALIPKSGKTPSIASMLKDEGYTTTAIHPFNGGMYKRNIALKNEGFDEFITELEMDFDEHDGNSEYINDRSAYQQVLKTLREGGDKQVVGLITMQNHTPYNYENYETHNFNLLDNEYTTQLDESKRREIETYMQTIHSSDEYLGEFISELDQLEKKVVVLFYGDHSPGVYSLTNEHEEKEVRDLSRITPYFFYANYDAGFKNNDLPTTSPNCMINTMLNELGWQKNSRYYLLDDVCSAEPILAQTWVDGREFEDNAELMRSYELLTYDILGGKKYWHDN